MILFYKNVEAKFTLTYNTSLPLKFEYKITVEL